MSSFLAAFWVEARKARRSRVPLFTALGVALGPLMGGLFMVILKDPERARSMGIINTKAQLVAGRADWPTFLELLAQTASVGGLLAFSFVAAWVFGREFSDRTAKELLALPTSRSAIVGAKFATIALWVGLLTALIAGLGLAVGAAVDLPGATPVALRSGVWGIVASAGLTLLLMPAVSFFASLGRGYLAGLGWGVLTLVLAQIVAATGWGGWFPWSVPALYGGVTGPHGNALGPQSYALVALTAAAGLAATFAWWRLADQTR